MHNHCSNCGHKVHVPDDRTGLIHSGTNKYACQEKGKRLETVAE